MEQDEIAARLAGARSAVLGTIDRQGRPHLVPIVFAYRDEHLYSAVDRKPKSTYRLKRLRNIEANPCVSVLVDHYSDDWSRLWWVRLDGVARVLGEDRRSRRAIRLLAEKYETYAADPPPGPVIEVRITRVRAWSAT